MGNKRKKQFTETQPKPKKKKLLADDVELPNEDAVNSDANDNESVEEEEAEMRNLVRKQNRKKKSGGFQSMGLSSAVYKGIMKKGFKVPTPIQRKTIPVILDGKDVVAMARTGSGKTAAFLVPMFERLKAHSSAGVRALILSPTRELALQTLKFTKELGKFTDIRAAVILGGDRMDDQFAALHENPDLIIATPGRLMHVLLEMNLKLQTVEYVVFDEADRLFEMGFQEQLLAIISRLPESRQTLLFSATLPKLLVDFAKAGLHDPMLVRLDVDSKLSDQLKLIFLQCRSDDKTAVLIHLLQSVIKKGEQTVVFVATKHHVEFLNMLLTEAGIKCSYSYSALDQMARKLSVAKFRNRVTDVLIVTDLAARGIDIPMLDNVINYHFPAKSKLFIHRVGRVARAGRSGTAYSLVAPDEVPFVIDLHMFLGRLLKVATVDIINKDEDGLYGKVPQSVIDSHEGKLRLWMEKTDIQAMQRVISNAYKQYIRSRPAPSSESIKRVKELTAVGYHPVFESGSSSMNTEQAKLLDAMKSYRPHSTIFEINSTNKTQAFNVMKQKRAIHSEAIVRKNSTVMKPVNGQQTSSAPPEKRQQLPAVTDDELKDAFAVTSKKTTTTSKGDKSASKAKSRTVDVKNFIPYQPTDFQTEQGLALGTSFDNDARVAVLDMTGDDDQEMRRSRSRMVWDRKRKKFVRDTGMDAGIRKHKTESGTKISSNMKKKNFYKEWLEKNKMNRSRDESDDDDNNRPPARFGKKGKFRGGRPDDSDVANRKNWKHQRPGQHQRPGGKRIRNEIREKSQIVKERTKRMAKKAYQAHRADKKTQRKFGAGKFSGRKR